MQRQENVLKLIQHKKWLRYSSVGLLKYDNKNDTKSNLNLITLNYNTYNFLKMAQPSDVKQILDISGERESRRLDKKLKDKKKRPGKSILAFLESLITFNYRKGKS